MSRNTRLKFRSIRTRLLATFIASALLLLLMLTVAAYYVSSVTVSNRVEETFSLALDYIAGSVDAELSHIMQLSDYLFVNNTVKESLESYIRDPDTFYTADNHVYRILNEYALSHVISSLNCISVDNCPNDSGVPVRTMRYKFKYYDIDSTASFPIDPEVAAEAISNPRRIFWSHVYERQINPGGAKVFTIRDICLYRAILDSSYKNVIGVMRISVDPEYISDIGTRYLQNYTTFIGECEILLADENDEILSARGSSILGSGSVAGLLGESGHRSGQNISTANGSYRVYTRSAGENGWTIIGLVPAGIMRADSGYLFRMSTLGGALAVLICGITYYFLTLIIARPLWEIGGELRRIGSGETDRHITISTNDELKLLCDDINSMLDRISELNRSSMRQQLSLQEAQFSMYQEQINPHFVANTLNAIKWLAEMGEMNKLENAIAAFDQINRYASNKRVIKTTITEETDIAKKYLYLQQLAHPDKFHVTWHIQDSVREALCLKFFLQPILENSILHGACTGSEQVEIYISIYGQDDFLFVNVYDDGSGIKPERLEEVRKGIQDGHIGLNNIVERLNLLYEGKAQFQINSEQGVYTNVIIQIPLEFQSDGGESDGR